MLDIQEIRKDPVSIKRIAEEKGFDVDIDEFIKLDQQSRDLLIKIETERAAKNDQARFVSKEGTDDDGIREKGKRIKANLAQLEKEFNDIAIRRSEILDKIPNTFPEKDTPLGGEEANRPEKNEGKAEKKDVQDHLTWGEQRGYIDFERGAKVAGSKFYYTKGPLVELEYACIQLALSTAIKHGFTPLAVPHLVNEKIANGTGYSPKSESEQIYTVDGGELSLIATSEIPITGYHAGEILSPTDMPLLYVGVSPAYRKEAGAYGKHSKGLYRVHQFNKVEMYVFCQGELEESEKWQQKLIEIEEELCGALEIPYQLVRIAAGDLGAPAYKKYDIEYWSPVEGKYRELMSCSNVTDYQARRLKIRYKDKDGRMRFVHTLNGTAMAFSRTAIALIENHQQPDGKVKIPAALQPFMSGKKEII